MPRQLRPTRQAKAALALTAEQQDYGGTFIRLSEYSSTKPLNEFQQDVLLAQGDKLSFLALTLVPQLHGAPYLKASHIVGSARFVHDKRAITVQVEPKIGNANFLRMLDYTIGLVRMGEWPTELSLAQASPVGLFLDFFVEQVLAFLHRPTYRSYSFAVSAEPGIVKGRPLVRDYSTRSLPKAMPYVLPCRFLELSPDVLENQIIAYAVHVATQMTSLLPFDTRRFLVKRLC